MSRDKVKKILAIETSCDETAMAVVECAGGLRASKFKILAEVVASQIPIHRPFGGVVPNLAKREHIKNLPVILNEILSKLANKKSPSLFTIVNNSGVLDQIAVTVGPGLEPALWAGITFAQELGKNLKVPVIGANHLDGHIYSNWITNNKIKFPAICLIVSGGHTTLLLMKSLTKWQILGETRDDAAGEAFDKVAKMLNLPYPGGPEVEKLAEVYHHGDRSSGRLLINFPRPMIYDKNYDFSFSGLKTAVLYYLRDNKSITSHDREIRYVCASFQKAAVDVLVHKTIKAVEEFKAKSVLLCGGVAANKALRNALELRTMNYESREVRFFVPEFKYNTDNAVMIAAAAYLSKKKYKLEAQGNLSI